MEITSGQPAIQVGSGGYADGGWGGGGWGIMFLAFLAMMGGGFWGGRGGSGPGAATAETVTSAVDSAGLRQQGGQIMAEVQRGQNAVTAFAADKYMELQRDIAGVGSRADAVLAQLNTCCCEVQRAIDAQTLDFTKQSYEARIHTDEQFCSLREDMNARFCALNSRLDADENRRLRDEVDELKDDMRAIRSQAGAPFFGWPQGFGA